MDELKSTQSSALFTDFYELTMAQGYFKENINHKVVFDMFFRKNPFNGGFSVLCGTQTLLDKLLDFKFSDEDIEYLRSQNIFCNEFLDYLKSFKFSGDIYMIDEGSVVFPDEPLLRIHANLIEAQIIEGLVLNIINFQSLIATKTARIWLASQFAPIMEFGLRRAQGYDGAMSATRAAYVGGSSGTSNTLAGQVYDIPVMGTMAHSWIMSFPSELEAFRAYAKIYPQNSVFLIDTYDTLKSGVKNAIIAGGELVEKGYNFGVRLDSGDTSYLSKEVRRELDKAGFSKATISVSNELTEDIISALINSKSPIDSWGVGTHMVTGGNESSFTGVYKLCSKFDKQKNTMVSVMKFSDNPHKTTNPGIKNVYRLYDENGMSLADILALEDELIEPNKEQVLHHPMLDYRQFTCKPARVEALLKIQLKDGKRVHPKLSSALELAKSRQNLAEQLAKFDESYKRILNPHVYKVSISKALKELKVKFVEQNIK
ncbi:nicotinate phosphoribosyltransferase, subgroup A [Campylobacter iguaniorum]|uniref:Nicotinate phosphoribosyltransferase n=1 Tax=Campylobacter iguaniorum TaxID=1244531 RepID=A0A076FFY9_9BACT|nr:nicotinate phosphoribosyltransferase [Campylobacter iguaniorum]AII14739.1 nicotinate phosphoribosyltransferase, subgroup A [Campylobacter iguaniorum]